MGSLGRTYVVVSCLVFTALLGAAAFLGVAYLAVPEWVKDVGLKASSALASLTGNASPDETGRSQSLGQVCGPREHLASVPESGTGSSPQRDAIAPGGIGGLASEIRRLEHGIAGFRRPPAAAVGERTERGEAERKKKEDLLRALTPRTLVRVLLADDSLPDDALLEYLSGLPAAEAEDALDRLSRLMPERAGRLLRELLSARRKDAGENGPDRPEPTVGTAF